MRIFYNVLVIVEDKRVIKRMPVQRQSDYGEQATDAKILYEPATTHSGLCEVVLAGAACRGWHPQPDLNRCYRDENPAS